MMRHIGWCCVFGSNPSLSTLASTKRAAMVMGMSSSLPQDAWGLATDEYVEEQFKKRWVSARVLRVFMEDDRAEDEATRPTP